jgi:glutamine phosphoribosylpyrophosphate amidotransferase
MKTECGLIGTFINKPITKEDLWYSLAEIQHRGQDSYGFVSIQSKNAGFETKITKEKGLLPEIEMLDIPSTPSRNPGENPSVNPDGNTSVDRNDTKGIMFLGHMRYSTNTVVENLDASLGMLDSNIQPVEISRKYGIYIAHNGNLPNLKENMKRLGLGAYYKNGMSDTYLFKVIWNVLFVNKFNDASRDISRTGAGSGGRNCKLAGILEYLKYIVMNIVGAYSCVMTFCEPVGDGSDSGSGGTVCGSSSGCGSRTSISSISSDASGSSSNLEDDNDDGGICGSAISNNAYKYYLIGFRDRYGYKPLSIGKFVSSGGTNYCFFSESVQLQDNKYFIRDVAPGEIWYSVMNSEPQMLGRIKDDFRSNGGLEIGAGFLCSLEAIYFMKHDTRLFNGETTVNTFRRRLGIELAKQDVWALARVMNGRDDGNEYEARMELKKRAILYMPESSYGIALGYSEMLGTGVRGDLITKIMNIRSFIENSTEAREGKLKRKFAFNDVGIAALGDGAEIVLIDDTIVRGNSMRYVVSELLQRNPGLQIHIRIGSPPLVKGCSFGIDLYDDELIASKEKNLAKWLGVASVVFLDIAKLQSIFTKYGMTNCQYCFGVGNGINKKTLEW